jgi:hypothetical protein
LRNFYLSLLDCLLEGIQFLHELKVVSLVLVVGCLQLLLQFKYGRIVIFGRTLGQELDLLVKLRDLSLVKGALVLQLSIFG